MGMLSLAGSFVFYADVKERASKEMVYCSSEIIEIRDTVPDG
jgi:hypothetical protein